MVRQRVVMSSPFYLQILNPSQLLKRPSAKSISPFLLFILSVNGILFNFAPFFTRSLNQYCTRVLLVPKIFYLYTCTSTSGRLISSTLISPTWENSSTFVIRRSLRGVFFALWISTVRLSGLTSTVWSDSVDQSHRLIFGKDWNSKSREGEKRRT